MALSLSTLGLTALVALALGGPAVAEHVGEIGTEVITKLHEVTKRCVVPAGDIDISGARYNDDGHDILNICRGPSERWGIRTQFDLGAEFDTAADLMQWCAQEGQYEAPFQAYRYPATACQWAHVETVTWIDYQATD